MPKKANLGKINKKLKKAFEGKVDVRFEDGNIVLTGEVERWVQVVKAGMIAASENKKLGIINDVVCTVDKPQATRKPAIEDTLLEGQQPDVLIIGGGIIGCAAARELSKYNLTVMLIDKEHDVAMQATGSSTGLVHSGFRLKKGSQKQLYTKRGCMMMPDVCRELGVTFDNCGQYMLSKSFIMIKPLVFLLRLFWRWRGFKGMDFVGDDELMLTQPGISNRFSTAVFLPSGGVVCPHSLAIAYAENAVQNGVAIVLDTMVTGMTLEEGYIKTVETNRGTIYPRLVINAAGVFCDDIAAMAGERFYSIHPVRGTSVKIDPEKTGHLINGAITIQGSQVEGAKGSSQRQTSVLKTNEGAILAGPFPLETISKEDFLTDRYSIDKTTTQAKHIVPKLEQKDVISCFSGVEAITYTSDFVIRSGEEVINMIHAAGIHYPGLTAAPAIAVDVAEMAVAKFGGAAAVGEKGGYNPVREVRQALRSLDAEERESLIAGNPDYGITVCYCMQITRGEIVEALSSGVRCESIEGIKRRTGAGSGECQGQCCTAAIMDIIAQEKQMAPQNIFMNGGGSEIVYGNAAEIAVSALPPEDPEAEKNKEKQEKKAELSQELRLIAELEKQASKLDSEGKGDGGDDN